MSVSFLNFLTNLANFTFNSLFHFTFYHTYQFIIFTITTLHVIFTHSLSLSFLA